MNWKDVPIPPRMAALPKDPRGFPVPHIVIRDKDGKPVFSANDTVVVMQGKLKKLCGVCGQALGSDSWVLGGPMSAFHPQGVYIDNPIHKECGVYALQVCPYLAYTGYRHNPDLVDKLDARFEGTRIFVNPTQDNKRVPFFVFGKVKSWTLRGDYVIPVRPFLETEFWLEGKEITKDQAVEILRKAEAAA